MRNTHAFTWTITTGRHLLDFVICNFGFQFYWNLTG